MFGYDDGPEADEYGWWWCETDADSMLVAMARRVRARVSRVDEGNRLQETCGGRVDVCVYVE